MLACAGNDRPCTVRGSAALPSETRSSTRSWPAPTDTSHHTAPVVPPEERTPRMVAPTPDNALICRHLSTCARKNDSSRPSWKCSAQFSECKRQNAGTADRTFERLLTRLGVCGGSKGLVLSNCSGTRECGARDTTSRRTNIYRIQVRNETALPCQSIREQANPRPAQRRERASRE